MRGEISYKTHILIGVRPNGAMTVIADWSHVPKQVDVLMEMRNVHDSYATFALCTRTSILPADTNGRSTGGWHRPVGPRRS